MRNSHIWVFSYPHQPLSPIAFAFPIPSPPWIFPSIIPSPCIPNTQVCPVSLEQPWDSPTPSSSVLSQMYLWYAHNTCTHTQKMESLVYILLNRLDTHLGHFLGHTGYYIILVTLRCWDVNAPESRVSKDEPYGCLPLAAACPVTSPVLVLLSLRAGLSRLCCRSTAPPVLTCGPTALTRDK